MPRFQSWLFNSIDRSLPVQMGRRARLSWQQLFERLGGNGLPKILGQVGRQVTRIALYPVYLVAIAAKRAYPQLPPSRNANPNSELNSDRPQTSLLLGPFQKLIVWAENTNLYAAEPELDRQTSQLADTENTPGSISSQANVLPQVGQQQVEQEMLGQYEQPLDRIRQLIKAAIAYFFGKKPTISPSETAVTASASSTQAQTIESESSKLKGLGDAHNSISPQTNAVPTVRQDRAQLVTRAAKLVSTQYERQFERILQLIKAAIAYFFGKKPTTHQLETVEVPSQPWLTMSDLFDDDSSPWPRIEPHESARSHQGLPVNSDLSQSQAGYPDSSLVKSVRASSSIASKRRSKQTAIASKAQDTPGEIVPDLSGWLEDLPDFEPEETYQPFRAWIETKATFLGYVYSPIMEFLHGLDRLIARFEQWLIQLWQKIWNKLRGNA